MKERGFSEQIAINIVSSLFEAVGLMLSKSGEKPALLKEKVCSPGGTTLAGLSKLMEGEISEIIKNAFEAAEKRAIELSRQK